MKAIGSHCWLLSWGGSWLWFLGSGEQGEVTPALHQRPGIVRLAQIPGGKQRGIRVSRPPPGPRKQPSGFTRSIRRKTAGVVILEVARRPQKEGLGGHDLGQVQRKAKACSSHPAGV